MYICVSALDVVGTYALYCIYTFNILVIYSYPLLLGYSYCQFQLLCNYRQKLSISSAMQELKSFLINREPEIPCIAHNVGMLWSSIYSHLNCPVSIMKEH